MFAVFVTFAVLASSFVIGLAAAAAAPEGYQDEAGFHFGQPQGTGEEALVYSVAQPRPA